MMLKVPVSMLFEKVEMNPLATASPIYMMIESKTTPSPMSKDLTLLDFAIVVSMVSGIKPPRYLDIV